MSRMAKRNCAWVSLHQRGTRRTGMAERAALVATVEAGEAEVVRCLEVRVEGEKAEQAVREVRWSPHTIQHRAAVIEATIPDCEVRSARGERAMMQHPGLVAELESARRNVDAHDANHSQGLNWDDVIVGCDQALAEQRGHGERRWCS